MEKIELIGKLTENNLIVYIDQDYYDTFISQYPIDTLFQVTLKKGESTRSTKQNNLYWKMVEIIQYNLKFNGYENIGKNDVHNLLKNKFLTDSLVDIFTGEVKEYVKSTTDLDKKEFLQYIRSIEIFALESLGLDIPKIFENYKNKKQ